MFRPLLETKLYLPSVRPRCVSRPRLAACLDEHRALTLISAPPGFGKTSLIAEWLAVTREVTPAMALIHNDQPPMAGPAPRVAWLALDADDDDPARFFTYLCAALQTQEPDLGAAAAALLESPQLPPLKAVVVALANDLVKLSRPLVLVLDDYHVIESQSIHAALAYLLDHLPPTLRLVLATRTDPAGLPLARLRARDQLREIRADDLRFTLEEATQFLNQMMNLALSPGDVAALEARTEGWVAGLQLAALSLEEQPNPSDLIAAFSGSHRHVLSYLAEETLNRQPEAVQAFLLRTSILQRLCAPLCDALLETGESGSQSILDRLERANLFLFPLDADGCWFRYHPLFADALRVRLHQTQPSLVAVLHQRAGQWLEQAGQISEALRHLLAAGAVSRAAALVEHQAGPFLERGEIPAVRAWVEQLPSDTVRSRPGLVVIRGTVLAETGHVAAAEQWLAECAALLYAPETPIALLGELAQLRATLCRLQQDLPRAIGFARQALTLIPPDRLGSRIGARVNLALASLLSGDTATANQEISALLATGDGAKSHSVLTALVGLGWYQARQGRLTQAAQTHERLIPLAERLDRRLPAAFGVTYAGLGLVYYERNQMHAAIEALGHGIELLRGSVEQRILAQAWGTLADGYLALGDELRAMAVLEQAEGWLAEMGLSDLGFVGILQRQRVVLSLRQGNVAPAARWVRAKGPFVSANLDPEQLVAARVWIARGRPESALELLQGVLLLASQGQWQDSIVKCHVLCALAYQLQGRQQDAFRSLESALALAQPEQYVRTFLDLGEPMRLLLAEWRDQRAARLLASPLAYADRLLAGFRMEFGLAKIQLALTDRQKSSPHVNAKFWA